MNKSSLTDLPHILNWRRVDAGITTSGQMDRDQLAEIAATGTEVIVNLGPHESPKALPGEPEHVSDLGMTYEYIPVDFSAPTDSDFGAFCEVLDKHAGAQIHVHCIFNARVSAFFTRYAQEGRGGDAQIAFARMDSIWRPGHIWSAFLGKDVPADQPNQYKGYDYGDT